MQLQKRKKQKHGLIFTGVNPPADLKLPNLAVTAEITGNPLINAR